MSEWIEWAGGECPVPSHSMIEVRCRNGTESLQDTAENFDFHWHHLPHGLDIIAYRMVKEKEE